MLVSADHLPSIRASGQSGQDPAAAYRVKTREKGTMTTAQPAWPFQKCSTTDVPISVCQKPSLLTLTTQPPEQKMAEPVLMAV
jgi:hypothetical protein